MAKIRPSTIVHEIRSHWKAPAEGKYISYREFAAYSVGGIGVNTINSLLGYVALAANCFLMGSAYGIRPTDLAYMSVAMSILGLVKTPFISMMIDNTNSKYGKFRPYLLYTGIPSAVLIIVLSFIPLDADYTVKCVLISILYALLSIVQGLYSQAFGSLAQVLTPNGGERTTLLSVSSFVYNLGPSIVNLFLPILSTLTGGMTNVVTYRVFFPIFSIAGVLLGFLAFKDTREKIIVPKDYVAKVKFKDGFTQTCKNKYFWLINLYNILGSLRGGIGIILSWYCIYEMQNDAALGILNTILGTASVPGMLLAPLLERKIGKRNALLAGTVCRSVFAACMYFTMDSPVLFIGCLYLANLATGGDYVLTSSMTADIFDYQQWKTGARLEGFITQFGSMLVTGATMLTSLILPFFYEHYGLYEDYTVLYDAAIRTPIFNVLIISTVISCILPILPLFFYNLDEKKHTQIVGDLKARVAEEDAHAE